MQAAIVAGNIVNAPHPLCSTQTSSGSILRPTTPQRILTVMPSFIFSQSVAPGAVFRPLDGWQYQYLPWPAQVSVLSRSTLVDMAQTYTSGSETIVEESPVQAGGTAGSTPSPLNTPNQGWDAAAGDLLKLTFRNNNAGANVVDGIIEVSPLI